MKKYTKYTALAMSALMLFGAAGCQKKPEEPAPVESTEESTVESTEEVTEVVEEAVIFDNLADASEAMGFEIPAPEAFGDYALKSVAVYSDYADLYFAKAEAEEAVDEEVAGEEVASEDAEALEGAEETVEEVVDEDAPQAEATETEEATEAEDGLAQEASEAVSEAAEAASEALEGAEELLIDAEAVMPEELVIRVTKSTEDVFADENEYGEDVVINDITLKMMGEIAGAACWTDGDVTLYMYLADANLANEDIVGIIDSFKMAMMPVEELEPIEEMPTEVAPEEAPTEEAPVEDAPVEEAPADETTDAN